MSDLISSVQLMLLQPAVDIAFLADVYKLACRVCLPDERDEVLSMIRLHPDWNPALAQ